MRNRLLIRPRFHKRGYGAAAFSQLVAGDEVTSRTNPAGFGRRVKDSLRRLLLPSVAAFVKMRNRLLIRPRFHKRGYGAAAFSNTSR